MCELCDVTHACLLYENINHKKAAALPFIKEGLDNGEHCLFISREESIYDWCLEFQAYGIDVKQELDRGSLEIVAAEGWRPTPRFSSLVQARALWGSIRTRLRDFSGVRIMGDAEWARLEPGLSADRLCHWEATADLLYQGESVKTICMYDLNAHSPADLRAALRTHPTVLAKGQQYSNPHYEALRILENEPHLNESAADRQMVLRMMAELEPAYVC